VDPAAPGKAPRQADDEAEAGDGGSWYEEDDYATDEDEPADAAAGDAPATGTSPATANSTAAEEQAPVAEAEEAELAEAEGKLFFWDEAKRDVAAGVTGLEGLFSRLDALLAVPPARRQLLNVSEAPASARIVGLGGQPLLATSPGVGVLGM
jgi:hypothetical protein